MKLYTVVVYDLRICMNEDNLCPNYFKEVISSVGLGYTL